MTESPVTETTEHPKFFRPRQLMKAVEVVQWNQPGDHPGVMRDPDCTDDNPSYAIPVEDGNLLMTVEPGDYIVTNFAGDPWVFSADQFKENFETVPDAELEDGRKWFEDKRAAVDNIREQQEAAIAKVQSLVGTQAVAST